MIIFFNDGEKRRSPLFGYAILCDRMMQSGNHRTSGNRNGAKADVLP